MIDFKIDKGLVEYMGANKLKLDELFILTCFCQNKLDLLKTYLAHRNPDQCTAYLQSLERRLVLRKLSADIEFDWDNYEVTEIGHVVYSDIADYTKTVLEMPDIVGVENSMEDITDQFLELFPDVKNAAGERLRSNRIDTRKKLEQFMTKYKIKDKNLILEATERYLRRMKTSGYQYCSCAMYFILKDGISKLATECESSAEAPESNWEQLA
jgi:hypothetical protein